MTRSRHRDNRTAARFGMAKINMLVGVDWGGTKIEAIGIAEDGRTIAGLREVTPRADYEACLATVASVVIRVEAEAGATGSVGIGIPGSVDPATGLATST
jgi:fructokinase